MIRYLTWTASQYIVYDSEIWEMRWAKIDDKTSPDRVIEAAVQLGAMYITKRAFWFIHDGKQHTDCFIQPINPTELIPIEMARAYRALRLAGSTLADEYFKRVMRRDESIYWACS